MTTPGRSEDELRAAMRAHDHEAPSAADFHPHVQRPTRLLAGVAAAAVVALIAAGAVALSDHSHTTPAASPHGGRAVPAKPSTSASATEPAALACPRQYSNEDASLGRVPAAPTGFDASTRLVPSGTPISAVLCDYQGAQNQTGVALHGARVLTGNLSAIADTLPWAPPVSPRATVLCGAVAVTIENYLIKLVYRSGVAWVVAPDPYACTGTTTNGTFRTLADVNALATHAYEHGTWPDTISGGRLGQQTTMVPDAPTSLTITAHHPREYRGPEQGSVILTSGFGDLVDALNAAQTSASTMGCSHSPKPGAETDELTFHYAVGPDVSISLMQGCFPEVDNGNLQIRDGSAFFPMIDQLLRP